MVILIIREFRAKVKEMGYNDTDRILMKFEYSAGGVVYRRTDKIEVLVCQHSQHHGWVFPKGLIGDTHSASSGQDRKETKEEAALREVEEETGIQAKIIKPLEPVTYWYQFEGEKRKKTVYYFLMEYLFDTQKRDDEMEAVEWLPINNVEQKLTYPSDKSVWNKAKQLVARSL